jgi:hypothetical protein
MGEDETTPEMASYFDLEIPLGPVNAISFSTSRRGPNFYPPIF